MQSWGFHKYGQTYDAWPRTPEGETEEPAFLAHCSPLDMEAEMLQTMLEAYGIPSVQQMPGAGAFGKVILGLSGSGVDIYVPESRLEEARELLKGEPVDDELQE